MKTSVLTTALLAFSAMSHASGASSSSSLALKVTRQLYSHLSQSPSVPEDTIGNILVKTVQYKVEHMSDGKSIDFDLLLTELVKGTADDSNKLDLEILKHFLGETDYNNIDHARLRVLALENKLIETYDMLFEHAFAYIKNNLRTNVEDVRTALVELEKELLISIGEDYFITASESEIISDDHFKRFHDKINEELVNTFLEG